MIAFSVLHNFQVMVDFLFLVDHPYSPEQGALFLVHSGALSFLRDTSSAEQGAVRVPNFDEISNYLAILR